MKGLLRKDFYTTLYNCRSLLIISLTFMVVSVFAHGVSFFILFPGMYLSVIGLSLYSIDETQGWLRYSLTLPYGRDLIVTERYLFNLIISALGLVVFLVCQLIHMITEPGFSLSDVAELIPFYLISGLAAPILNLPCMFKLGAEKGRIVYYATIAALAGGLYPATSIINQRDLPVRHSLPVLMILLVFLALYAISWQVSIRFFRKREL